MNLFEDRTLKKQPWAAWKFIPYGLAALVISIILYVVPLPRWIAGVILLLVIGFIVVLLVMKLARFNSAESKEIREYEEKMRKMGR